VSNLIERVLVIDRGHILMDEDTDAIRNRAANIVGDASAVEAFVAGRQVIHREKLGNVASVTVLGALSLADRERLAAAGLDVAPVSLQQLIVRTTTAHAENAGDAASTLDQGALR
jgi:ABC-2 type transport system ATP-binding protein